MAFAYATYNPVIVAAGHETKIQSIALMPLILGAVIWVEKRIEKYVGQDVAVRMKRSAMGEKEEVLPIPTAG